MAYSNYYKLNKNNCKLYNWANRLSHMLTHPGQNHGHHREERNGDSTSFGAGSAVLTSPMTPKTVRAVAKNIQRQPEKTLKEAT